MTCPPPIGLATPTGARGNLAAARHVAFVGLLIVGSVSGLQAGGSLEQAGVESPPAELFAGTARHVIIVTIDGLRADLVGEKHTPNLARMIDEARLVRQLLEAEGLAVLIKGEHSDSLHGEIPIPESMPTVWVLGDGDEGRAREVLEAYLTGEGGAGGEERWTCPGCGEEHAAQFGACWNCGGAPA